VLVLQQLHEFNEVLVIHFLLVRVLLVDSFERVVVKDSTFELSHDLELKFDYFQTFLLEVELDGLMTKFHEDVVEHDFRLVFVGGNLKLHDLAVHELESNILILTFRFEDQCTRLVRFSISNIDKQQFHVANRDETCCLLVIHRPDSLVVLNGLLLDRHACHICLTKECINNNGDEQVKENLRHDDLEQEMESDGEANSTTFRSVCVGWVVTAFNNGVVVFDFLTLVED